jgi:hypothetical protein
MLSSLSASSIDMSILDHVSGNSVDNDDDDNDELENEPVRLNRASRKSDTYHHQSSTNYSLNDRPQQMHESTRHGPTRLAAANNTGVRSNNNVSFMSDASKRAVKSNGIETIGSVTSANHLKQVETLTRSNNDHHDSLFSSCSIVYHRT